MHRSLKSDCAAITGGAGFIGHRLADRLLSRGMRVVILDDLSAASAGANAAWLRTRHGHRLRLLDADIRDGAARREMLREASVVFHLAAQTNPLRSLSRPRSDFALNARASAELVADLLAADAGPALVFASGRQVYGSLRQVKVRAAGSRLEPLDRELAEQGIGETWPVDFATPLACSKGAAEQHVLGAAARGAPAVVVRLGAVYGPGAAATGDIDSLSGFALRVLAGEGWVAVHGDGRQTRDWLHVDDAVEALLAAAERARALSGEVFNAGGGPANTASELELLRLLLPRGPLPPLAHLPVLQSEPGYFVCDNRKFAAATGWTPLMRLASGIEELREWINAESRPAPDLAGEMAV